MGGGNGHNTIPRPNSGDDFNEIEQQASIIERMDEETMNDKFEEMLVSRLSRSFTDPLHDLRDKGEEEKNGNSDIGIGLIDFVSFFFYYHSLII